MQVLDEIITVYDLDGVHLDYIRYSDSDFGYNMSARIMFEEEYGIDPFRLIQKNRSGNNNLTDLERKKTLIAWGDFRRNAITELVKSFNELILKRRPDCLLTAAVKPNLDEAHNRFFQEWDRWLTDGLIDYAVPMNYAIKLRDFAQEIENIRERLPQKYWPGLIMGVAAYNQDIVETRDKIRFSRVTGLPGVAVFSYDAHKTAPHLFLPIAQELSIGK